MTRSSQTTTTTSSDDDIGSSIKTDQGCLIKTTHQTSTNALNVDHSSTKPCDDITPPTPHVEGVDF